MKYLRLALILILLFSPKSFADNSPEFIKQLRGHLEYNETYDEDYNPNYVYLEPETKNFINITQPQKIGSKALNLKKSDFSVFNSNLKNASAFSGQEYAIGSKYGYISETIGKWTFGTEYDSSIDDAEITYMTGVYTKLDGKHLALTVSARTETGNSYSRYTDKFVIAPEWKITKRLSLLDIAQTDVKQTTQKNEVVLRYNPKLPNNYNDLFLELGAGQTFHNQDLVKSSIRFSTKFKL